MSKNLNGFPLDDNSDPIYPECKLCSMFDGCQEEYCETILTLYPDDFKK